MQLRLTWVFVIGAVLGSLGGTASRGAANGPSSAPESTSASDEQEIASLVQRLGDKSYRSREEASRRLARVGKAAQKALSAAERDSDREIRSRAHRALRLIEEAEFAVRLEAFAADPNGNEGPSLPAWDRYRAMVGRGASRELFVTMQASQPQLMAALDADPRLASQLLTDFCTSVTEGGPWREDFDSSFSQKELTSGALGAMLFAAVSEGVVVEDTSDLQIFAALSRFNFNPQPKITGPAATSLKKLTDLMILKEHNPSVTNDYLEYVMLFNLSIGVQLAERTLASSTDVPTLRSMSILALGKLGDRSELPLIEKYLTDEAVIGQPSRGRQRQTQVRDVALAVLVQMTGQSWKDYGFTRIAANRGTGFEPDTATFPDAKKRDAALERWRTWSATEPKP